MFSPLIRQLIEALQNLPGVGPKSAQRLAFFLLSDAKRSQGFALSKAIEKALNEVGQCQLCQTYSELTVCELCVSPKRNDALLCVVESPADVVAIEQTNSYSGRYFVLQGRLSPLDGIGPNEIGIPKLLERLNASEIRELIIATNLTVEGKATAHYIANHIDQTKIKCTRIAHGVPLGGELEYLDGGTLSHALHSRIPMDDRL